jgi:hypothetical protein
MQGFTRNELRQELFKALERAGVTARSYECPPRGMVDEERVSNIYTSEEDLTDLELIVGGPNRVLEFPLEADADVNRFTPVRATQFQELAELIRIGNSYCEVNVCVPIMHGRDMAYLYVSFY